MGWTLPAVRRLLATCAVAAAVSIAVGPAPGVIILGSGDPNANDVAFNPPTPLLTNSGLQWVGQFEDIAGVVISPQHFLCAFHIDFTVGIQRFTFQGVTYTTVESFKIPGADLCIWKVAGTFPVWAPLFENAGAELGRHLVVFGGGTQRGAVYNFGGTPRGWLWGNQDGRLRWGENKVAELLDIGGFGQQIYATFDATAAAGGLGHFECHLSNRDSGGPVFIREGGVWKVAAVNFSVDGYFAEAASGGPDIFLAALTDCSGLHYDDGAGNRTLIPGPAPVPTGFYSTRVAPYLAQIRTYLANTDLRTNTFGGWQAGCFTPAQLGNATISGPLADPDADGLTNLQECAFASPPWMRSPEAYPVAGTVNVSGSDYLTISYNRAAGLQGVTYVVEASSDLQTWQSGTGVTTLVSETTQADVVRVVVRDQTAMGAVGQRHLRVRVSAP